MKKVIKLFFIVSVAAVVAVQPQILAKSKSSNQKLPDFGKGE